MLGEFQNDQQFVEKIKLTNNLHSENQTRNDSIFTNITSKLSTAQYLLAICKYRVQKYRFMNYIGENLDVDQN